MSSLESPKQQPEYDNTNIRDEKTYSDTTDTVDEAIREEKSIGVEKAEILAKQWEHSFWYKLILGFSAFLCGYAYGLDAQTRYVYVAYSTSSYGMHSLLTLVNVAVSIAAAASQPVYARLSDVFGRLELFIVAVLFYVVGTIIECQSPNIHAYVAGAIFYQIGYSGVIIMLVFILSDFSSLRWRLFFTLCPSFPYIINTWISGNVTAAIGMNWKWGIGMWAFIFPLASIPITCCMIHMRWLAGKTEEWRVFKQRQTKFQELGVVGFGKYLFWKLDIIGLIFLIASLGCLLAPLTLAGGVKESWKKAHIIVPIVIGGVLIPVFIAWEAFGARDPIMPVNLMKDRGIWSVTIFAFLFDFVFAVEANFLYTVLMVAVNQSQAAATRISSISAFTSTVVAFFFGLFVVYFRRLKGFIIFGSCMWLVSFGILLHFRQDESSASGIIGGMVLLGFSYGFFSYPMVVSAQASVSHEHLAVITSAVYTTYRVGYAVGSSVAGAVWTQTLYPKLVKRLGDATLATSVYSDPYTFIAKYTWGTPERMAAVAAYGDVQKTLMTICLCFVAPMIIVAFFMRDHKLTNDQTLHDVEKQEEKDSLADFFRNFGRTKQDA
ncbi:ARN1 Siderophore iron transporter ARN1 [Candida maltosa Xu316]|uniref:Ferrichrome-type siderophore transporter n=1 Tax=Candida maltosa (strain Xu316) TaxID=1245528 RepID=M3JCJ4_CANMX|nr:Ferrichrome-type siderophore transporter [Candida maltosa Xu316]